jgi:hypothetical protein
MKRGVGNYFVVCVSLIWLCSLVVAGHNITTSTGGVSYSVDEDIENVYNISVNNTDSLLTANITQVNITMDSGLFFVNGTNGTDVVTSSFLNTSTVLSWSNDSLVMNMSTQYFWFNVTVGTPGDYNLVIATVNDTGTYTSNISITVNDTTAPTWINATNWSSYNNQSVAVFLNASDEIGISDYIVNDTTNFEINASNYLVNVTVLSAEFYILNLTVNDSSGNRASRIINISSSDVVSPIWLNATNWSSYTNRSIAIFLNASDEIGIANYTVNDTTSFEVNSSNYLVNITPLSDAFYILNLTVNDSSGNEAYRIINISTSDYVFPTWLNATNWSSYNNQSIAIFLNASDDVGVANYTVNDTTNFEINSSNYLVNITPLSSQVYILNLSVNDSSGNTVYRLLSVTMTAIPAVVEEEAASTSSSSGSGIYYIGSGGVQMLMSKGVKRMFRVDGALHELTLVGLEDGVANIKVESDVSSFSLKIGESAYDDLDGDSVADINITFLGMTSGGVAKFNIVELSGGDSEGVYGLEEDTTETEVKDGGSDVDSKTSDEVVLDEENVEFQNEEGGMNFVWFLVPLLVIIVVLAILRWQKMRKETNTPFVKPIVSSKKSVSKKRPSKRKKK